MRVSLPPAGSPFGLPGALPPASACRSPGKDRTPNSPRSPPTRTRTRTRRFLRLNMVQLLIEREFMNHCSRRSPLDYRSRDRTRFCLPDLRRVVSDGAVAGELAGTGHVDDRLARPGVRVGVQLAESLLGLGVRG